MPVNFSDINFVGADVLAEQAWRKGERAGVNPAAFIESGLLCRHQNTLPATTRVPGKVLV